jgi:hypothetical protein
MPGLSRVYFYHENRMKCVMFYLRGLGCSILHDNVAMLQQAIPRNGHGTAGSATATYVPSGVKLLQAVRSSPAQTEAVLHLENARLEPMARQAAHAFGDNSIPENIVILKDSDGDELQWGSPRIGT